MSVFVHGFSSTPVGLLDALADYSLQASIKDVELIHMTLETDGKDPFPDELYDGMTNIVTFTCFTTITFHAQIVSIISHVLSTLLGIIRSNSFFIGPNLRQGVNRGMSDFIPICLSEIPLLFHRKIIDLDVALIHVSPPDEHGFCTLGPSVDITRSAIQNAKFIIGEFIISNLTVVWTIANYQENWEIMKIALFSTFCCWHFIAYRNTKIHTIPTKRAIITKFIFLGR